MCPTTYNSTYQKCGHWASAFAKAVDNLFIFALQMANKNLALLVSFSVENGFKAALLVAANRYAAPLDKNRQTTWDF
jgi:hypothetical protein